MILSDEEVDERLTSERNLVNRLVVKELKPNGGRTKGATEIPPEVRKLIGIVANDTSETQEEVGNVFGVSDGLVSMASRGLIVDRKDKALAEAVQKKPVKSSTETKIDSAHEEALDVLMGTLGSLNARMKLPDLNMPPRELSKIATDMSRIVSNLKPANSDKDSPINQTQVVVYMPAQRREIEYEVIDA